MTKRLYQCGIIGVACAFVAVLVACGGGNPPPPDPSSFIKGEVSGGGWLTTDRGKANFGFSASNCEDPANPTGTFNFHDKTAPGFVGGVKINGEVVNVGQCTLDAGCKPEEQPDLECPKGGYVVQVTYTSTNPRLPGTGTAVACLVDNGEGINGTGDLAGLIVGDGPFEGYQVRGTIKGNIQAHLCE